MGDWKRQRPTKNRRIALDLADVTLERRTGAANQILLAAAGSAAG
jgi:hypothetical protein